ncbi:MAG: Uma2 family endonuclease [Anaerolineae bacterium]
MFTQIKPMTIQEFITFAESPENADQIFEFINGEMSEVSPARTSNSNIRDILAFLVRLHCRENTIPCYTSGEAGAFLIRGNILVPDFAYKPTPMSTDYPDSAPPTLVAEIISPTDEAQKIRDKRNIYRAAGIVYLEIYPVPQSVDVYRPGTDMQTVDSTSVIDLGDVITGFKLDLSEVFKEPV